MTNDEASSLITTAIKNGVLPEKIEVSYVRRNSLGELQEVWIEYESGGKCHTLQGKFKVIAQTSRDKIRAYNLAKAAKKEGE